MTELVDEAAVRRGVSCWLRFRRDFASLEVDEAAVRHGVSSVQASRVRTWR